MNNNLSCKYLYKVEMYAIGDFICCRQDCELMIIAKVLKKIK